MDMDMSWRLTNVLDITMKTPNEEAYKYKVYSICRPCDRLADLMVWISVVSGSDQCDDIILVICALAMVGVCSPSSVQKKACNVTVTV